MRDKIGILWDHADVWLHVAIIAKMQAWWWVIVGWFMIGGNSLIIYMGVSMIEELSLRYNIARGFWIMGTGGLLWFYHSFEYPAAYERARLRAAKAGDFLPKLGKGS